MKIPNKLGTKLSLGELQVMVVLSKICKSECGLGASLVKRGLPTKTQSGKRGHYRNQKYSREIRGDPERVAETGEPDLRKPFIEVDLMEGWPEKLWRGD